MATTTASAAFSPTPSLDTAARVEVSVARSPAAGVTAVGVTITTTGASPADLGFDRQRLTAAGFTGRLGSTLALPRGDGPMIVAVGIGDAAEANTAALRDAAAAYGRATRTHDHLGFHFNKTIALSPEIAAQAIVEGIVLARYTYGVLKHESNDTPMRKITLIADPARERALTEGADRGVAFAAATMLARDLGNTPHNYLTAARFAEVAVAMGSDKGFEVEVFNKEDLIRLGCGGLLGVNAGSTQPPRMIKLTYRPAGKPTGRLSLVGKGVMYDSGGISLKPSDMVHARMKNDMAGAAAVLAAVSSLRALDCRTMVTAYLMCTDNMPSGTAMALGDVITIHGGKTVEVIDTDAEGRIVMSDALALAAEEQPDAIIDIATLTGSCARALGDQIAGVLGNHQGLVDMVRMASESTDELVWQLPLHWPYRDILNSGVADLQNCGPIGKPDAIVASLYLSEFVGDVPWAHIDIAGTAWNEVDRSYLPKGSAGFGARLLLEVATNFVPPVRGH